MSQSEPDIRFDWAIYADATFAGLSMLIPIPLLDWVGEHYFRRRILTAVLRRRNNPLRRDVWDEMQREPDGGGCLAGCFGAILWLLQTIYRKLVYVLTIKEASEKLSYYWQRAFLLDYMLGRGHLQDIESARMARTAMEDVLASSSSPLRGVANQVVGSTRNILRALLRARRGRDSASAQAAEAQMRRQWNDITPYLRSLAGRYETAYEQLRTAPAPTTPQTPQANA